MCAITSAALMLIVLATIVTTRNTFTLAFSLKPTHPASVSVPSSDLALQNYDVSSSRRHWLKTIATTGSLLPFLTVTVQPSFAAPAPSPSSFQTYADKKYGFSIDIPSNWNKMNDVTALSDRRSIVVYTDPNEPSTSILIVYTPIRDDYTSLSSFGSVDQVAVQTILPKGNLLNEDNTIVAKMISAISAKQSYIFDYLQQVPEVQQPLTHYRTIFTLGSPKNSGEDGNNSASMSAGAMLITITLQTPESRYNSNANNSEQAVFDTMINSYTRA
jgi:PsbP